MGAGHSTASLRLSKPKAPRSACEGVDKTQGFYCRSSGGQSMEITERTCEQSFLKLLRQICVTFGSGRNSRLSSLPLSSTQAGFSLHLASLNPLHAHPPSKKDQAPAGVHAAPSSFPSLPPVSSPGAPSPSRFFFFFLPSSITGE